MDFLLNLCPASLWLLSLDITLSQLGINCSSHNPFASLPHLFQSIHKLFPRSLHIRQILAFYFTLVYFDTTSIHPPSPIYCLIINI